MVCGEALRPFPLSTGQALEAWRRDGGVIERRGAENGRRSAACVLAHAELASACRALDRADEEQSALDACVELAPRNANAADAWDPEDLDKLAAALHNGRRVAEAERTARFALEKVEEVDPEYREVSARIERLGVAVSKDDEDQEFDDMFDSLILKE